MSKHNEVLLREIENAERSDMRNPKVPDCLYWSVEAVAEYFERTFPQYRVKLSEIKTINFFSSSHLLKDCFISNNINGRRLIWLDSSRLPKIGITDFKHILVIIYILLIN